MDEMKESKRLAAEEKRKNAKPWFWELWERRGLCTGKAPVAMHPAAHSDLLRPHRTTCTIWTSQSDPQIWGRAGWGWCKIAVQYAYTLRRHCTI